MHIGIQPLLPIGNFLNKRYSIDMDFPDDSNPLENFKYLNDIITAIHMSEYPMCYKEGKPLFSSYHGEESDTGKVVQVQQYPNELQSLLDGIDACTEVDGEGEFSLKTFWLRSKSNLTASAAYKEKEKQLTNA